jgi:hypothetical protein
MLQGSKARGHVSINKSRAELVFDSGRVVNAQYESSLEVVGRGWHEKRAMACGKVYGGTLSRIRLVGQAAPAYRVAQT